jgi:hypothetical protein
LELATHVLGVRAPNEAAHVEKLGQWHHDGTIVMDELVIVAAQPQERAYHTHYGGHRLVENFLNLELVVTPQF